MSFGPAQGSGGGVAGPPGASSVQDLGADISTATLLWDDFTGDGYTAAALTGALGFASVTGGGAVADGASGGASMTIGHPGIVRLQSGTGTTDVAAIYTSAVGLGSGGGERSIEYLVWLSALSIAGDEYSIFAGEGDLQTATEHINGAYFKYSRLTSVNWLRVTSNNSTRTTTDTGVAVVAGAWVKLKIVINSDASSVEFFINGVSAGLNTTNIMSATNRTGLTLKFVKSAGTTAGIAVNADYCIVKHTFSTSR